MVHYNQFNTTPDTAFNIRSALLYCKNHHEDRLVFDKAVYRVKKDLASEKFYTISNHNHYGLKRICFLLEDMHDFTIDGGGSEFVFEDIMIPVSIDCSSGIHLENMSFFSENTLTGQFEVVRSAPTWAEMKLTHGGPFYVYGEELYFGDPDSDNAKAVLFNECDARTGWIVPEVGDAFFSDSGRKVICSRTGDGLLRLDGLNRQIPVGNSLNFACDSRRACQILINESSDTHIQNVTIYNGLGMGVIVQNSEDIFLDHFNTRLRNGRTYSVNADATHFVHCRGRIQVKNCLFEGQLDDALNVHSIYLRIVKKTEHTLLLRFGHPETRGIRILQPGSVIQTVDPASQLPNGEYTVKAVRYLNLDSLEVDLEGDLSAIRMGDLIDEVSWKPDVLFENCVVRNNRARGMLLSSAGETVVRGNLFQTPGGAILFESSGDGWYESGGVKDVLITENTFDNCRYSKWCQAVIEVVPRRVTEEGRYYHGKIAVVSNVFKNNCCRLASVNNAEEFIFMKNTLKGNDFSGVAGDVVETEHCRNVRCEVLSDTEL